MSNTETERRQALKHIRTIAKPALNTLHEGGCGECRTSCQSACKTSCTVANQECENTRRG